MVLLQKEIIRESLRAIEAGHRGNPDDEVDDGQYPSDTRRSERRLQRGHRPYRRGHAFGRVGHGKYPVETAVAMMAEILERPKSPFNDIYQELDLNM